MVMNSLTALQSGLLVVLAVYITRWLSQTFKQRWRKRVLSGHKIPNGSAVAHTRERVPIQPEKKQQSKDQEPDLLFYKDYFHKIQNLEKYPEILAPARDLLLTLFAETLEEAQKAATPGILAVKTYSPESLAEFIQAEHDTTTQAWEEYVARRAAGAPTELFKDKEECLWWLRQVAPVKYVDGAWLGHVNKITTPFHLREATKDAWQIMSEELGDGEPVMNHVYVYRELMREVAAGLPDGDELDFIHPRHGLNEVCSWKAAVAQLLISLFPNDFLPEILGFNMHFEALTMETMKAAKEVEEFGFNAYYFILHISIDNADSGHTAIAMQAVIKYIDLVRQADGEAAAQQAWKRVQVGFILSQYLSSAPVVPSKQTHAAAPFPRDAREAEVMDIFRAKAPVAHKIHCNSRIKLRGRTLVDWLEPESLSDKQWQMDFMDALSNFRPWIRKGNSGNSKLVQELSWGGKMFGSFTKKEVEAVCRWIDAMGPPNPRVYWSFVDRAEVKTEQFLAGQDIRHDYPVFSANPVIDVPVPTRLHVPAFPPSPLVYAPADAARALPEPDMTRLLPLWFTSQCLLEAFVNVPAKTTTATAASIVRVLRTQYGFDVEGFFVSGTDEARRNDSAGIIELGLEMMRHLGLSRPRTLKDILERYPSDFALQMLHLSMRPMENFELLMGLSWAFVSLHDIMSRSTLIPAGRKALLRDMVQRERKLMETICSTEFKGDSARMTDFYRGYIVGREKIEACFPGGFSSKDESLARLTSTLPKEVSVSA